jgi:arylsulfatase B
MGLGYHGSEIETPNIDRLVAEGVEMNRFYAFPVCSPTRVALMTGRSPNRMGIGSPIGSQAPAPSLDEHFLPQSFKDAGYQTWMFGKWHTGDDTEGHLPNGRGFDYFYGHRGAAIDYYAPGNWRNKTPDWYRNDKAIVEEGYSTFMLADDAIKKVKMRDKESPFLLYLPFNAGHTPLQAPKELIDKYSHRAFRYGTPELFLACNNHVTEPFVVGVANVVGRARGKVNSIAFCDVLSTLFCDEHTFVV